MDDLKTNLKVDFSFIYFDQSLLPQKRNIMNITKRKKVIELRKKLGEKQARGCS